MVEDLNANLLTSFDVAKVFKDNNKQINAVDFDVSGSLCITSSDDESLRVYDVKSGKLKNTVYSKKYGCCLARFTHGASTIIYASTKQDDALRYMSFHDNNYIRYFKGHSKRVVSLDMSPKDDTLLSGSLDDTVRLWDLKSPNCQALLHTTGGVPLVSFDHSGVVFAVGLGSSQLRLYSLANFSKGPFLSVTVKPHLNQRSPEWSKISFSKDGKHILISTKSNVMYLLDAFKCQVMHVLRGHVNDMHLPLDGCFTPDGAFVLSGSQDNKIYCWDVATGQLLSPSLDWHRSPPKVVAFNPKYMMFASADTNLVSFNTLVFID